MSTLELVDQFMTALRKQYPELNIDARVCMVHESVRADLKKEQNEVACSICAEAIMEKVEEGLYGCPSCGHEVEA